MQGRESPTRWCRMRRWGFHLTINSLALYGVIALIGHACFTTSRMVSGSMSPTLQGTSRENGDWVLTERISYCFRKPRRWEVMTINDRNGKQVMKRVTGLPRETMRILSEGQVTANDVGLTSPAYLSFLHPTPDGNTHGGKPISCGDGYFVLGDDSTDSYDSRFRGPVKEENIVGRAWIRIRKGGEIDWVR